ncbi:hypothetical protein [uncultured Deefgea sp.]|uniref:hypothetical protein n=1 Tax=uncultured Deefgea sp. TaxID=1304914 RepID=UPI002591D2EF|nr:hypothetical protein [uncultured Deefgea sp.]
MATETPQVMRDQLGTALLDIAQLSSNSADETGIQLSELIQSATSEVRRFGEDLASHLQAYTSVTVPPAFQLQSAAEGKIQVVGEHPHKEEIENYLNQNTRLLKWFKELEVLLEIQRKMELTASNENIDQQVFNFGLTSLGGIAFFTKSPQ